MKYRFEVMHCPSLLRKAMDLMGQADLGLRGLAIKETLEFSLKKDVSLNRIKQHINLAYQAADSEVVHISGGAIE